MTNYKDLEKFYLNRKILSDKEIDPTIVFEPNLEKKIDHPIMIIGEAPGGTEVSEQRPFCGPAGSNLEKILSETNLSREKDLIITNIVPFRTFESTPNGRKNRTPSKNEYIEGGKILLEEISIVKPRLIFLLGGTAFNGVKKIYPEIKGLETNSFMQLNNGIMIGRGHHPSPLAFNREYIRKDLYNFFKKAMDFIG